MIVRATNSTSGLPAARPEPWQHEPQGVAGKAVVVTGGTTGIGRATAMLLASAGARVLTFGRHQEELDQALRDIAKVGQVHGLTADASREVDLRRVFDEADQHLGGVDILINNAAVTGASIIDSDYDHWQYVVQTNLLGYMACCRFAIDRMKTRGQGHIVNVGSMSADEREPGHDIYVATKGAIQAFSQSLRKKVHEMGVKVTLIEPGLVGTDMPAIQDPQQQRQKQQAQEMLVPEDIAECVLYCLMQPPRCDVVTVQIRPHKQAI